LFAHNLPAVQVARAPQRTWHTLHDSIDDVAAGAMRMGIHLYAEALYRLVNMPEMPFARQVTDQARQRGQAIIDRWFPKTLAEARRGVEQGLAT